MLSRLWYLCLVTIYVSNFKVMHFIGLFIVTISISSRASPRKARFLYICISTVENAKLKVVLKKIWKVKIKTSEFYNINLLCYSFRKQIVNLLQNFHSYLHVNDLKNSLFFFVKCNDSCFIPNLIA